MNQQSEPKIEWHDGKTPVSVSFDDPYFSQIDGLAETRHVFLDGNRLTERYCEGFVIAELGFGTGLNLLAALDLWMSSGVPGQLRYTSFERAPLSVAQMRRAISVFPQLETVAAFVFDALQQKKPVIDIDTLSFELIVGDARDTLSMWDGQADAWFLDGFAPAKNPEMWEPDLLAAVGSHTRTNGTFATYTAAGHVRRGLRDAGFEPERRPGFGRKRHMTAGRLKD